jgi:DNA-binding SARP family transcriptional activator
VTTASRTRPTTRLRSKGATAATALSLLALLVAPPLALGLLIGDPLLHGWPTVTGVRHALTSPVSDTTVLRVFAVVVWLAWLHLCACVLAEFARQLRGASWRVPLGGVNERLAQHLVAGVLVAVHTSAAGGLTPAWPAYPVAAVAMSAERPVTAATADASVSVLTTPLTVDGSTEATVGGVLHDAAVTDRYREYVVAPPRGRYHDNLWDIAGRHLGDPLRWREIFTLNEGRRMPDGSSLTRASLIRPGWVLRMPADATGLPPYPAAPPLQRKAREPAQPLHPAPAPPDATHATAGHAPRAGTETAPAEPVGPAAVAPSRQPTGNDDRSDRSAPIPITSVRPSTPAIPVGAGLGVAAIAALATLERRRRSAARRRRPGTRLRLPEPPLAAAEATLRRQAGQARVVADTVRLAVALAGHCDPTPTVRAALHRPDGTIELVLDNARTAPAPFTANGARWLFPPDQHGYLFPVTDRDDPVPVLAPLGTVEDAICYLNLEPLRLIGIDGQDAPDVDAIIAGLLRGLAGAPWAEQTQMVVPARLAAAAQGLDRVDVLGDPPTLLDHLTVYATRVGDQVDGALDAARRAGTAEAVGVVVLIGFTADELPTGVLTAVQRSDSPLIAMLAEATADGQTWRLDEDGLHVPGVPGVIEPVRATEDDVQTTNQLLEQAADVEPALDDDPQLSGLAADCPPDPRRADPDLIEVNMLGPIELRTAGKPRRAAVRELVLYLALHRRPVPDTTIAARLWPDREFSRDLVRTRMGEVRRMVKGAILHQDHSWAVTDVVTSDWQRFQALAAGDDEERRQALALVRGRPFDGYEAEWVAVEGHDRVIEAAIVDLALDIAQQALEEGDDRAASQAVEAGLRACPFDERLYRLGMRAAAARNATGEVRAYVRNLRTVLDEDIEPEDHMEAETQELYEKLTRAERRAG